MLGFNALAQPFLKVMFLFVPLRGLIIAADLHKPQFHDVSIHFMIHGLLARHNSLKMCFVAPNIAPGRTRFLRLRPVKTTHSLLREAEAWCSPTYQHGHL